MRKKFLMRNVGGIPHQTSQGVFIDKSDSDGLQFWPPILGTVVTHAVSFTKPSHSTIIAAVFGIGGLVVDI
jgi:hypothetical protein